MKSDCTYAYVDNVIANPELLISAVPKEVSRARPSLIDSTHGINKRVGCPRSNGIRSVKAFVTALEGNSKNVPKCASCRMRR
jgi:hypothetical protein